jgi:hypothetical protein
MENAQNIKEPEIMPTVPKGEPKRIVPEIPPYKNAPEENTPIRGWN